MKKHKITLLFNSDFDTINMTMAIHRNVGETG